MKQLLVLILLVVCMLSHAEDPWKLDLIDRNKNIILKINLDEECIEVPGMEAFGPMHGYLGGNIYGVWAVTSFRINNKKAILRLSNDLGSETQEVELTQTTDSTYQLKLVGTTVIKRVEGHKLHKISPTLTMVNNHK
ncbi:MAG: hypothetical protein NC113_01495 [Bacteroides sp.]|nr:hypothetical protein [Bacteroides sp.]MCM1446898.1 hypothetical protein [Bacteroides sp.]MCM1515340.1 hypothetical protein [Paraprevotella sp.]